MASGRRTGLVTPFTCLLTTAEALTGAAISLGVGLCLALSILSFLMMPALTYAGDAPLPQSAASRGGDVPAVANPGADLTRAFGNLHAAAGAVKLVSVVSKPPTQAGPSARAAISAAPNAQARGRTMSMMSRQPLTFIENRGQTDPRAAFYLRNSGGTVWVTHDGLVFDLIRGVPGNPQDGREPAARAGLGMAQERQRHRVERAVFRQEMVGGSQKAELEAAVEQRGAYNFLIGKEPSQWRKNVKGYAMVTYRELWPHIDLRLHGLGSDLEQVYIVRAHGDPGSIRVGFHGSARLRLAHDGALVIATAAGELRQKAPVAYQHVDGKRVEVAAAFRLTGADEYTFRIGSYRHDLPLVIDPVLLYSTYLGGVHDDTANAIAVDSAGNSYVTGWTASQNFPVSANAYQKTRGNLGHYIFNAFVSKFAPSGTLLYSTFIGGSSGDFAYSVQVDQQGAAYFVGQTVSADYPTTAGAFQTAFNNCIDGFVTKLSPDGSSLEYSTYLGGSKAGGCWGNIGNNFVLGISLDPSGDAFVGGATGSADFPTTPGAYQTKYPLPSPGVEDMAGFITELAPDGSHPVFSSFFGGTTGFTDVASPALDASGNVVLSGSSTAANFPVSSNAYQKTMNGPSDAFVAELNGSGSSLLCSTLLGGSGNEGANVVIPGANSFFIAGSTNSTDFPTTPGVYSASNPSGNNEVFVAKMKSDCSTLELGSYVEQFQPNPGTFGNNFDLGGIGFVMDSAGDFFVASDTPDQHLPTTSDAVQKNFGGGTYDGFLMELDSAAKSLLYATYLGGSGDDGINSIGLDAAGNIYAAGATNSADFPVTSNAFQSTFCGTTGQPCDGHDAFLAIIGTGAVGLVTPSSGGNVGSVTLTITGTGFDQSASASLVGPSTINSMRASVSPDGTTMKAIFELTGATPGSYKVIVSGAGGPITARTPFVVEKGGGTQLFSSVVGRAAIRANTPSTFYVTYGNSGNVDAYFVMLWLIFPSDVTFAPQFKISPPPQQPGQQAPPDWSKFAQFGQIGSDQVLGLMLPAVPAGTTASLGFQITDPNIETFQLSAAIYPELSHSLNDVFSSAQALADRGAIEVFPEAASSNQISNAGHCFADVFGFAFGSIPGLQNCAAAITSGALGNFLGSLGDFAAGFATGKSASTQTSLTQLATDMAINAGVPCLTAALASAAFPEAEALALMLGILNALLNSCQALKDCGPFIPGLPPCVQNLGPCTPSPKADPLAVEINRIVFPENSGAGEGGSCSSPQSASSLDPNDKGAPTGVGPQNYVPATNPLTYVVQFENEPSTPQKPVLPAQQVVVTDQLNPQLVALGTLSLGLIQFGNTVLEPPVGASSYSTTVDLGAQGSVADFKVEVQGSLNPTTGLLTWTFRSIDASTGLPPADPSVGFLPPDNNPPQGEGSVVFSVMPASGIANGTQVKNQANVVFDQNSPIMTPIRTVTLAGKAKQALFVSPRSLSFGKQVVFGDNGAESATGKIELSNPRGAKSTPILISKILPPAGFVITNPGQCLTLLNPGDKCAVYVAFSPTRTGAQSGKLAITDNASNGPQQFVTLSGTGVAGTLKFQPTALDFGKVNVGTTSPTQTLTMLNQSGAQALVERVTAPGDFVLSNDTCSGARLDAHKSCTVDVAFSADVKGTIKGRLTVTTDSAKTPQFVKVTGEGVPP